MEEIENPFASPRFPVGHESPEFAASMSRKRAYVSLRGRAKVAVACMGVWTLGGATQLGLMLAVLPLGQDLGVSGWVIRAIGVGSLLLAILGLANCIAFVSWFYRASANLPALGNRWVDHSPGWAIGGWFIPIGNLWIPYNVMAEIWRGSYPRQPGEPIGRHVPGIRLVQGWWWAWLAMAIVPGAIEFAGTVWLDSGPPTARSFSILTSFALAIVFGAVSILVIRRTTANQESRLPIVLREEADKRAAIVERGFDVQTEEDPSPAAEDEPDDGSSFSWLNKP